MRYQGRSWVPSVDDFMNRILEKGHGSCYSIQPGSKNMYHDISYVYWREILKKDTAAFVAKCPNCQQVKVKHQNSGGLLQEI